MPHANQNRYCKISTRHNHHTNNSLYDDSNKAKSVVKSIKSHKSKSHKSQIESLTFNLQLATFNFQPET